MPLESPGAKRARRTSGGAVEVVWSPLARARLREIRTYIALDKPDAAGRLAARIVAIAEALRGHPHLGRASSEPGVRELVVGGTPYVILYRIRGKRVTISTIWHSAKGKISSSQIS